MTRIGILVLGSIILPLFVGIILPPVTQLPEFFNEGFDIAIPYIQALVTVMPVFGTVITILLLLLVWEIAWMSFQIFGWFYDKLIK